MAFLGFHLCCNQHLRYFPYFALVLFLNFLLLKWFYIFTVQLISYHVIYKGLSKCPRNINGNSSFCNAQELVKSKAPTFFREWNFYTSNFSLDLFTIWREIKPSGCNCRRRTCCALNTAFALHTVSSSQFLSGFVWILS